MLVGGEEVLPPLPLPRLYAAISTAERSDQSLSPSVTGSAVSQ